MAERSDTLTDVDRLIERMARQLDAITGSMDPDAPESAAEREFIPVDLIEYDDEVVATVDLPGFDREAVDVRVTDHVLRIAADRSAASEDRDDDERVLRRERTHESVRRSLRLPAEVDTEAATARLADGVLTVTMPRLDAGSARHVDVD